MNKGEVDQSSLNGNEKKLRLAVHSSIKKVTEDFERFSFNIAISSVMEMVNALYQYKDAVKAEDYNKALLGETLRTLVVLLSPFIPHVTQELWEMIGEKGQLMNVSWPKHEDNALVVNEVEIVVQINGKIRGKLNISPELTVPQMQEMVSTNDEIKELIGDKTVVKVIAVPKKLINIVVK